MQTPSPPARPGVPRCDRCARPAAVLVDERRGRPAAACLEHLEWAFLLDVDEWSGRPRTA